MEYVATGGVSNRGSPLEYRCTGEQAEVLPLSIRVPRNVLGAQPQHSFDYCVTGSYSLLGLGDIIIPGIMVAYCAAFDRIRAVRYHQYFAAASVGYAAGLMLSYVGRCLLGVLCVEQVVLMRFSLSQLLSPCKSPSRRCCTWFRRPLFPSC